MKKTTHQKNTTTNQRKRRVSSKTHKSTKRSKKNPDPTPILLVTPYPPTTTVVIPGIEQHVLLDPLLLTPVPIPEHAKQMALPVHKVTGITVNTIGSTELDNSLPIGAFKPGTLYNLRVNCIIVKDQIPFDTCAVITRSARGVEADGKLLFEHTNQKDDIRIDFLYAQEVDPGNIGSFIQSLDPLLMATFLKVFRHAKDRGIPIGI